MKFSTSTLGKNLLWNTFLLVLITIQITTVGAAPGTTIRVEPYANIAQVGESFTINVTLTDVQNLYGVKVALRWNASVLRIVSVDVRLGNESHPDGILQEPIFIAINETVQYEGRYHLVGTSTAPADSFSGGGNIVKVTFNITSVGSCRLDLETELRGKPPPGDIAPLIEHTTMDGFFGHQVSISALPANVTEGEKINVSGSIIPAQANVEVTILYRSEGEANWRTLVTLETDEQGCYKYTWRPKEEKKYELRATAFIEDTQETSASIFVTVETPEKPTWVNTAIIAMVIIIVAATLILIYHKKSESSKPKKRAKNLSKITQCRVLSSFTLSQCARAVQECIKINTQRKYLFVDI